jgi:predicted  nucleic acid-binding Zn-ribbon protein
MTTQEDISSEWETLRNELGLALPLPRAVRAQEHLDTLRTKFEQLEQERDGWREEASRWETVYEALRYGAEAKVERLEAVEKAAREWRRSYGEQGAEAAELALMDALQANEEKKG